MEFADKLNYLFELVHAEGKELAAIMNVTPPQVSKMRNGIRGLPKNKEDARVLACFFAKRCNTDFMRDSLSKAIKVPQIRDVDDEDKLADIILDWLSDTKSPDDYAARRAGTFLQHFGLLFDGGDTEDVTEPDVVPEQSRFFSYYGSEGKRLAMKTFLDYIMQSRREYRIDILTDEDIGWVTENPKFSERLHSSLMKLSEQGCTFRRIVGPITDMDQAFDSLSRWFPLYMTGSATSYYYKRMRDNLNRVTLFLVPDVAVLFSFSVSKMNIRDSVTFFTLDTRTVNCMAAEFDNYLSLCEPIMNVYSMWNTPKELFANLIEFQECEADCMQRSDSLSFMTLPWDIAVSLNTSSSPEKKEEFLALFAKLSKLFRHRIDHNFFTDIVRLADAEAVVNGTAPIPVAAILGEETQYYTVNGYLKHLRGMLYLVEHNANYHIVLRSKDDTDPAIIWIKENSHVFLMRSVHPFTMFKVSEHYLVEAFTEFLRRKMPQDLTANKRAVAAEIRELIMKIESLSPLTE